MRCQCFIANDQQCARTASTKISQNKIFCWQHQNCKNIVKKRIKTNLKTQEKMMSGIEIKQPITTHSHLQILQNQFPITGVEKYREFLLNKQKTGSGKTYTQILGYNKKQLEDDHQFIQWLFPLPQPSQYAKNVPVIDIKELITNIKHHSYILPSLQLSYHLMMKHWGFDIKYSNKLGVGFTKNPFKHCPGNYLNYTGSCPPKYLKLELIDDTKIKLLNGHNELRLSRVLQSLVYHGLKDLAIYTLSQILTYTKPIKSIGLKPLLNTTLHISGITLWEHFLNEAINNYKLAIIKYQKKI